MLELQTSQFQSVLRKAGAPVTCDDCDTPRPWPCRQPIGLTSEGDITHHPAEDPSTVVSWPHCPAQSSVLWDVGGEVMTPARYVEWLYERGEHRAKRLASGAARIYREHIKNRNLPERLLEARHAAEMRRKSGR